MRELRGEVCSWPVLLGLLFLLSGMAVQTVMAQEGSGAFQRPAYQVLRQNEDWSVLQDRPESAPPGFFDPVKYIPLTDDGSVWVSFGAQVRLRLELWDGFNFGSTGSAPPSDQFLLSRILFHTDWHFGPHVRLFVQGKSSLVTHRSLPGGKRPLDFDGIDIQNGFLELGSPLAEKRLLVFRAGRQELLFGRQRLVSPLDWSNTRRTFDGATLALRMPVWTVTGFWMRPVEIRQKNFNKPEHVTQLFGLYAGGKIPRTKTNADLYWLSLDRKSATFNAKTGRECRQTFGARVFGNVGKSSWDYEFEAAFQVGSLGSADIAAAMFTAETGYRFTSLRTAPRIYLGLDWASGDDGTAGSVGTFNQLYPLGHAFLGFIDIIGRQNIVDLRAGASLKPEKRTTFAMDIHNLWRATSNDALYNAGGGVVRPAAPGTATRVGAELDLLLNFQMDRHTQIIGGYSHFFPGQFLRQTGPALPTDFGYLGLQFTF